MMKQCLMTLVVACLALAGCASYNTYRTILTVDDDRAQCPTARFTSLQEAVSAARPHDTIHVCPGNYAGPVVIPASLESLRLLGSGGRPQERLGNPRTEAIIEGGEPNTIGFVVQANGVTIQGFTIRHMEQAGIEVIGDHDAPIRGAIISGNRLVDIGIPKESGEDCADGRGINVEMAFDILVEGNVIVRPCTAGIRFHAVTASSIRDNDIVGSRTRPGIAIRGASTRNTIRGNISRNNREAGISVKKSNDNRIEQNAMRNNGIQDEQPRTIPGPGSNTDADDDTNLPLNNSPSNLWQHNDCLTQNRPDLC